jgi:Family of unknown function (DUF5829)
LSVSGQKLPLVNFNHFYAVIDSTDLHALQSSAFIKNKFAALATRTTKADSSETWTGTYLEGLDNYLELFDVSVGDPLGIAGLGFSVDGIGELNQLDAVLSKTFTTEKHLREKQYDDKKVPWYTALEIKDPVFDSLSRISFWVMEYKPEYFDYNHWKYEDNKLTRTTYLNQYEDERRNKILKRFTGLTLHATDKERQVISGFLSTCGYQKITDSSLASPEHFVIRFIHRNINDRYALASMEFETNMPLTDNIKVSENIEVQIKNMAGKIIFK